MYGSSHTHFESQYDTANNLEEMLHEFESLGAKKVAVTEHGEFTSFEDLKDLCADMSVKVIPGVEGYLTEEKYHFIIIAKNKEGYRELSNIITDANVNHNVKDQPIITIQSLKQHVKKGNLFCTTACIAGPFGDIYYDNENEKNRLKEKYIQRLSRYTDEDIKSIEELETEFQGIKDKDRATLPLEQKIVYKENHKKYLTLKRNRDKLDTIEEDFKNPVSLEDKNDMARDMYLELCDIFGRDDVYLEIQNHGIDKEQEVYPGIINFARLMDCTDKLIAANDIHIGKTKEHLTGNDFLRRQVIKFNRFNTYEDYQDWEQEIYIKDDDELKETLLKLPDITENEVDIAIKNIENSLSSCETDYLYEKDSEAHYPKFCDNEDELFSELIEKGIKTKFPNGFPSAVYNERLAHEQEVIKSMGYAGYHLIVQDYLDYAENVGKLPKEVIPYAPNDLNELKKAVSALEVFENTITTAIENHVYPGELIKIATEAYTDLPDIVKDHITCSKLTSDIKNQVYSVHSCNKGPGRGSAAGSISCYLLGITDIDPIQYNLLFERFLNPERVSMPDIDADFRTDIRTKCIEYCAYKYGRTGGTCKIVTKSYSKIKGNLRLAGRFYAKREICAYYMENPEFKEQHSKAEITAFEKEIIKPWLNMGDRLSKAIDDNTEDLPDEISSTLSSKELLIYNTAKILNGTFMGYGQHAAGTIISGDKLPDILPLKWNKDNENYETQCTMAQAENKGLLKMDFLGLENLDILTELEIKTKDYIITDYSKRQELLNNKEVLRDIFSTALTQGIFQFESNGMKQMLKDFRPDSFEDIILLVSAYRPGPMQFLPEIIQTKQYRDGRCKEAPEHSINIDNYALRRILDPTYGCIIYQEQVMQICTDVAGFTMGHADNVRKYMSKKKETKLAEEREDFIDGCRDKSGILKRDANDLFDKMTDFARYAFNKSHATCYALVSFFTAYYKKYYPETFFSVTFDHMQKLDEIVPLRSELSKFGLTLCPPSLEESTNKFRAVGNKIYFGYKTIKGMSNINICSGYTIDEIITNNPRLSDKTLIKLAETGLFDKIGQEETGSPCKADIVAYITDYAAKIVKKSETINKLKTLQDMGVPDKRKISGAVRSLNNIGEIPSFSEYISTEHTTLSPSELNAKMADLLGTVFLNKKEEKQLNRYAPFSELTENEEFRQFYVVSVDPKERRFKKSGNPYYIGYIMDGQYETKMVFMSHVVEPGIYQSNHVSSKPFLMDETLKTADIVDFKEFHMRPKSPIGQKMAIQIFSDIQKHSDNQGSYAAIYRGDNKIGTLSKKGLEEMQKALTDRLIKFDDDYIK